MLLFWFRKYQSRFIEKFKFDHFGWLIDWIIKHTAVEYIKHTDVKYIDFISAEEEYPPMNVPDTILNDLMERLQPWSFRKYGVVFYCYCISDTEW